MTHLTVSIIEKLLYEDEGTALDFKREQYRFFRANKDEKGELLKDILAFANSWRRSTAYILIGVDERRGDRSDVLGISEDLDDASLQQFVNSKTNRPVIFAYRTVSMDEKSIGVIEIPCQERPVYLTSNFGKLTKEKVYIRRGSSTAVASPDEVFQIGALSSKAAAPRLSLEWADLDNRNVLPSPCRLESVCLDPLLPKDTFNDSRPSSQYAFMDSFSNRNYSKEIIEFSFRNRLFRQLGFRLRNGSETFARRIRFIGSAITQSEIVVQDWADRPIRPYRNTLQGMHAQVTPLAKLLRANPDPCVRVCKDRFEITIEFGDIRPHDEVWTTTPILVGGMKEGTIVLDGELRGGNLPSPVACRLEAFLEVEKRPMEILDVQQCIEEGEEG